MRTRLRELLLESGFERVYESVAANPDIEKPYLVLSKGPQDAGNTYNNFSTSIEVWPTVELETFTKLDTEVKRVVGALHQKRFDAGDEPHYIEFVNTIGEDVVDTEWGVMTRGLQFRVYSLAWLVRVPVEPDPVSGMEKWTKKRFPTFQTDPASWDPQDDTPALYWRLANISNVEATSWGAWLSVNLAGHVINPDVAARNRWVEVVTMSLAKDSRTKLLDNSRMIFTSVAANSENDPFSSGQITLSVRFGVLNEKLSYEQLKKSMLDQPGGAIHVE